MELGRRWKPVEIDRAEGREVRIQPVAVKVLQREGCDRDPPAASKDPLRFGERCRAIKEVDDERHRDAIEPAVAEREPLRLPSANTDLGWDCLSRDGHHFATVVDRPHPSTCFRRERGGEAPGATADVQDPLTAEAREIDHRLEALPPRVVGWAERVVDPRPPIEVGRLVAHASEAAARGRGRRAPRDTSTGGPFSGNGISIRSKSRGTTVFANS